MLVAILFNRPLLPPEHADYASEAGVLEAVEAVAAALSDAGHDVRRLGVGQSAEELFAELTRLPRPDVVFNLCEGFGGKAAGEPHVAALMDLLGLPYTGSPSETLALIRDKPRAKRLLAGARLPTPDFWVVPAGDAIDGKILAEVLRRGPLIVKPAGEDASLGIGPASVVTDADSLRAQVRAVANRFGDVLVERYIAGREFNITVLALPRIQVLPLAEVTFPPDSRLRWPIVTYDAKWSADNPAYHHTPVRCPADVEPELAERIERVCREAFHLTGCRDYARIDLRVDEAGEPFILEINANPDISPMAGLATAVRAAGLPYAEFVRRVTEVAASRRTASPSPHQAVKPAARRSGATSPPTIRPFEAPDLSRLVDILRLCRVFRPDEIAIGEEVLRDAASQGEAKSGYRVLVADLNGEAVGWSCHGLVPLTDATYDLYWIAVDPAVQNAGVGRILLDQIESELRDAGGRWLLAETSASQEYLPTCRFYDRRKFELLGTIPDFYRLGDGRNTYGKRLR